MAESTKKKTVVVAEMPPGKTIVELVAAKRTAFPLAEFAELTGISYKTAFSMARDGRLPVLRIGSSIRLDPATTAKWLRERMSA